MEDSWFWEPEDKTSSSSSKKDENESPSAGDLTTITLDSGTEHEIIERLQRQLGDRDGKLKKLSLENALLNEKLSQLTSENKELTNNIDELDRQHSTAIEELLKVKNDQVERFNVMQDEFNQNNAKLGETLRQKDSELKEIEKKLSLITKNYDELQEKYNKIEKSYITAVENETRVKGELDIFKHELESLVLENVELKSVLETKENSNKNELDNILAENKKCVEELRKISTENNELQAKVKKFEEELKNSNTNDQNASLHERIKNLEDEITAICIENSKYKDDYETASQEKEEMFAELCERKKALDEFQEKFERDMVDVKDKVKFMEELEEQNEKLNRRVQELESQEKTISFADMKDLIKKHFSFESNLVNEKDYFDDFLESTKDVTSKLKATERQLLDAVHELNVLKEAYTALENEKEVLKTDLLNYEVECSELVKNNDILVMEVETLKTGKLETIPEQNEDIEILEQQLVDCSNSKQNLQVDYNEVKHKLDEYEVEKTNMLSEIESLNNNLMEMECKKRDLEMYIEGLENEKSNLLFEINELRADKGLPSTDSTNSDQINELEDQVYVMKRDNSELLTKIQELEKALEESEKTFVGLKKNLEEQKSSKVSQETEIEELNRRITNLQRDLKQSVQLGIECRVQYETELAEIQSKLDEALALNVTLKTQFDSASLNTTQQEQEILTRIQSFESQIKELETQLKTQNTCNEQLQSQITALNETIAANVHEKNELLHKLEEKTQEHANFQGEIERITQLHNTEVQARQNYVCDNCETLTKKLETLERDLKMSVAHESEKINDQMHFLREKADILTANLLTEQNNQKLLQTEKIQLIEKNQNLTKDLERLRQHLLEIEEGHTQEVMTLQKSIDESKQRLADMEEQVKHSSTAYTSAK